MEIFSYNEHEPLSRCGIETINANKALNDYYLLGSKRSLEKLFATYATSENPTCSRQQTLKDWSSKFRWQDRVSAYEKIEGLKLLAERQRRLAEWEELQWETSMSMLNKARGMLSSGVGDWSMDTIPRFILAADKIARSAVGENEANIRKGERQKTFNDIMEILQNNLRVEVYDEVVRCLFAFSRLG